MSYKSYRENLAREFYEKHSKSTEKQIALLQ